MPSLKDRFRGGNRSTDQAPPTENGNGHRELDLSELRPPRTTADRLRPFGRAALWIVLAIIFARGLAQIINPAEPAATGDAAATASWPDASAAVFALDFARTYLSFSGDGDPDTLSENYNDTVERFLTPELRGDIAGQASLPGQDIEQLYYSGEVVEAEAIDADHAAITVEALVQQDVPGSDDRAAFSGQKRIFLNVPVGRDESGRLALYAHPSLVAEAPTGAPEILDSTQVADPGSSEITDLVERFLDDYLSGAEAGELNFYLAPGTQLPPLDGGYRLIELQAVEEIEDDASSESERRLIATASVRDQTTDVTYTWQYLIDVAHRDRWYVAGIEGDLGETGTETATSDGGEPEVGNADNETTTTEPAGSQ